MREIKQKSSLFKNLLYLLMKLPYMATQLTWIGRGLYYLSINDERKSYTVGGFLERHAQKQPNRPAILYHNQTISYGELNNRVNQFVYYLLSRKVKKGDVIALLMENRPEFLMLILAASKIGAVIAPLPTAFNEDSLSRLIEMVKPKVFAISSEQMITFRKMGLNLTDYGHFVFFEIVDDKIVEHQVTGKESVVDLTFGGKGQGGQNPDSTHSIGLADRYLYIFTSGTSGMPKASILTYKRWLRGVGGISLCALRLAKEDIVYVTLPFYHSTALNVCWSSVMVSGAVVAIGKSFSAASFWDEVRYYRATVFAYVGELCRFLMLQPSQNNDRDNPVKKIVGNGLNPELWPLFKKRFAISRVVEFYASSEGNAGFANVFDLDGSVGLTVAPFCIVEYDEETKAPKIDHQGKIKRARRGDKGLLLSKINQHWPFDGYCDEEQNNRMILDHLFKPGDRWLNTGDVVRSMGFWHIQFVERIADCYRWRGHNISIEEVEHILHGFDPIERVVAYGVSVPGVEGQVGMVSIVCKQGSSLNLGVMRDYFDGFLSPYSKPVFVREISSLCYTSTLRPMRHILKKQGYKAENMEDSLYVLLPGENEYQLLTKEIQDKIDKGRVAF